MRTRIIVSLIPFIVSAGLALAAEKKEELSKVEENESYDKMKTLVGSWEGKVKEGDKDIPATARFQLIADGSTLAGWLGEGTPHEMVTMFHMDGDTLVATLYGAEHKQPRMVLVMDGERNRLVFVFKDGTNIQPNVGHMHQVAFIFDGPNHHIEEWTYLKNDKKETSRFDFKRKK